MDVLDGSCRFPEYFDVFIIATAAHPTSQIRVLVYVAENCNKMADDFF
jgi:hypothetical protein